LAKQNKDLILLSDKQRGDISDLTTIKVKLETDVEFHASQIKFHLRESESKQRKINDFEMRVTQLQNVVDQLTRTKSELVDEIKQFKISIDGKDTNISSLRYERSRLEDALREMKKQCDTYLERYEMEKKKFIETRDKLQALERDEMAIQKITKDFDSRVEEMSKENIALNQTIYDLEKNYEKESKSNEILKARNAALMTQNAEISAEIQEINRLKNQLKIELTEREDEVKELKKQLQARNASLKKDRKEMDRLSRRLAEMEQDNDRLEIEKAAHERTNLGKLEFESEGEILIDF
jgi:chromosome segregation ATPase